MRWLSGLLLLDCSRFLRWLHLSQGARDATTFTQVCVHVARSGWYWFPAVLTLCERRFQCISVPHLLKMHPVWFSLPLDHVLFVFVSAVAFIDGAVVVFDWAVDVVGGWEFEVTLNDQKSNSNQQTLIMKFWWSNCLNLWSSKIIRQKAGSWVTWCKLNQLLVRSSRTTTAPCPNSPLLSQFEERTVWYRTTQRTVQVASSIHAVGNTTRVHNKSATH